MCRGTRGEKAEMLSVVVCTYVDPFEMDQGKYFSNLMISRLL
jgi:hypothetical protein